MTDYKLKLGGKNHVLKFGYGVFSRISRIYKFKYFGDLGKYIDSLELTSKKDLKFEALDFIGDLVSCAVAYGSDDKKTIPRDQVIDELVFDPSRREDLGEVIQTLFDSFAPLLEAEGKANPAGRKTNKTSSR